MEIDAASIMESGSRRNSHGIDLYSLILPPKIGDFRNYFADLPGDRRPQLCGSRYNYGIIHNLHY